MLYPFNDDPAWAGIDPAAKRAYFRKRMLEAEDPVMGSTEYILGMMPSVPQVMPARRASVSGSSVVGLTPEQTTALLDRVQQQNQMEQRVEQEEQARRDRRIEGFGERVFRARELEQARRERYVERMEARDAEERAAQARREEERARWAEREALGRIHTLPDGSQERVYRDPATGALAREKFAEAQKRGGFQTVLDESGQPVRRWMEEGEVARAPVRGGGGAAAPDPFKGVRMIDGQPYLPRVLEDGSQVFEPVPVQGARAGGRDNWAVEGERRVAEGEKRRATRLKEIETSVRTLASAGLEPPANLMEEYQQILNSRVELDQQGNPTLTSNAQSERREKDGMVFEQRDGKWVRVQ